LSSKNLKKFNFFFIFSRASQKPKTFRQPNLPKMRERLSESHQNNSSVSLRRQPENWRKSRDHIHITKHNQCQQSGQSLKAIFK